MRLSPYARKEEILFIGTPLTIALIVGIFSWPLNMFSGIAIGLLCILAGFSANFFRHPKRNITPDEKTLYSPSDGTVTHIQTLDSYNDFLPGKCIRISMYLSAFNVHLNRNPANGTIAGQHYKPGKFIRAILEDCPRVNESNTVEYKDVPHFNKCIVVQISGIAARKIVSALNVGDTVSQGKTFGMIKFGSRTDLILPYSENAKVQVQIGDKMKGGETPIVTFNT